jgi:hypothetical protein
MKLYNRIPFVVISGPADVINSNFIKLFFQPIFQSNSQFNRTGLILPIIAHSSVTIDENMIFDSVESLFLKSKAIQILFKLSRRLRSLNTDNIFRFHSQDELEDTLSKVINHENDRAMILCSANSDPKKISNALVSTLSSNINVEVEMIDQNSRSNTQHSLADIRLVRLCVVRFRCLV